MMTAKDGTKWKKVQVGKRSTGRLSSDNILKKCPGPSSYLRRNILAGSPASVWPLFIGKFILERIPKCTITEAHRQTGNKEFCLANNELLACISVKCTQVQMTCYIMLCGLKTGACPCIKKQYHGTVLPNFTLSSV